MPGGKQRIQSYKQGEKIEHPQDSDEKITSQDDAHSSSSTDEAYQNAFNRTGDKASRHIDDAEKKDGEDISGGYTSSQGSRGGDQSGVAGQSTQGYRIGNPPEKN